MPWAFILRKPGHPRQFLNPDTSTPRGALQKGVKLRSLFTMEKPGQGAKHGKVDARGGRDAPARANHPVEHPSRNLQPPVRRPAGKAAAEDRRLLDHFMDVNLTPSPGMPRIKRLALDTSPVGVPSSSCTTPGARTARSDTDHRRRRRSPRQAGPPAPLRYASSPAWLLEPP